MRTTVAVADVIYDPNPTSLSHEPLPAFPDDPLFDHSYHSPLLFFQVSEMNPVRSESRFNSVRRDGALSASASPSPSRPPARLFPICSIDGMAAELARSCDCGEGGCDNGPIIGMNRKFVPGPRERRADNSRSTLAAQSLFR